MKKILIRLLIVLTFVISFIITFIYVAVAHVIFVALLPIAGLIYILSGKYIFNFELNLFGNKYEKYDFLMLPMPLSDELILKLKDKLKE